jgi:hypothetical protein
MSTKIIGYKMEKSHDISQRKVDGKWVVWTQINDPNADLEYHQRSGVPISKKWIAIAVCDTREEAEKASRESKI